MSEPKIDDGGPAFPGTGPSNGMSLRDWFAGCVLMGLAANATLVLEKSAQYRARAAYRVADAMVATRAGRKSVE